MKKEMRTVERKVPVYIANDGVEFDSDVLCREHEKNLLINEAEKRVKKIPSFYVVPTFTLNENEWLFFYVTSEQELEDIKTVYFDSDASAMDYKLKQCPCWVACVVENEGYGYIMDKYEMQDEFISFLAEVERKMNEVLK